LVLRGVFESLCFALRVCYFIVVVLVVIVLDGFFLWSCYFSCPAGKLLPLVSQEDSYIMVLSLQSLNIQGRSVQVRVLLSANRVVQLERL